MTKTTSKPLPLGPWELQENLLVPTRCTLQRYAVRLASRSPHDPCFTFSFGNENETLLFHHSSLLAVGGPLSVLVSGVFSESNASPIRMQENFETFKIIRRFVYLERINMAQLPSDMLIVADRWGLTALYHACFAWAERDRDINICDFTLRWMPVFDVISPVPLRFRSYFAMRFSLNVLKLPQAEEWLYSDGLQGSWSALQPFLYDFSVEHIRCQCPLCLEESYNDKRMHDSQFVEHVHPNTSPSMSLKLGKPALQHIHGAPYKGALQENAPASDGAILTTAKSTQGSMYRKSRRDVAVNSRGDSPPCAFETLRRSSVWKVLHLQGVLPQVFRYLKRFAERDPYPLLLDVIMIQLEPIISGEELVALLQCLDSANTASLLHLRDEIRNKGSSKAGAAYLKAQYRANRESGEGGKKELRMTWSFDHIRKTVELPIHTLRIESDEFCREGYKFKLSLRCLDSSGSDPLNIFVKLIEHRDEALAQLGNVDVKVQVFVVENGCSCELGKGVRYDAFRGWDCWCRDARKSEKLENFVFGDGIEFFLMGGSDFRWWRRTHRKECGLVIGLQMQLMDRNAMHPRQEASKMGDDTLLGSQFDPFASNDDPVFRNELSRNEGGMNGLGNATKGQSSGHECNCNTCTLNVYDSDYEYDIDGDDWDTSSHSSDSAELSQSDADLGELEFY